MNRAVRITLLVNLVAWGVYYVIWLTSARTIEVVNDGQVTQLTDEELCIQPGDPDGSDRCFELSDDTLIANAVNKGALVRVHIDDGDVTSIEKFDDP